ncbi:MAG TPA: succinic semialdehyde dehydrogenase [Acidimicrobiia bacterium]|nr:succinic semialdehyde dehydrogenase [Acidimicrobiia bacterium]
MTTTDSGLAPNVTSGILEELAHRVDVPTNRPSIGISAPFTESDIGAVPAANDEDVVTAVDRARRAQEQWSRTPIRERVATLSRFHDLLIERADIAMDIVQLEAGKARIPAFEEVFDTVAVTRYYMKTGPGLLKRKRRAVSFPLATTAYEFRHPHGVVGSITPWNFPFTLAISDIVPALLAGNTVVAKPDEKTPFSMLYGASLLEEAGLPEGVLQVVIGHGREIGPALIDGVDFIMFTGSTEVGRLVAKQAGDRLIGTSMELGGKNAAIVMADADLDKTVPGLARAVYANGGQLCISMERIYVDEVIRDEFTSRFVEFSRNMPMTRAFDFSSSMSSMISRDHLDQVHAHVEDAVAAGATLLTGGKPRPDVGPLFYEPTVLTDVEDGMLLCRAETFGPVVSIYGYVDLADAIAMANDSHLGLNFSVWTEDTGRGVEVATQLEAGTVGVNDGYAATWSTYDAPMGGMKRSGIGRRHGSEGLLKYTEAQTVAVQRIGPAFAPPPGLGYDTYQRLLGPVLKILKRLPFYK